MLIILHHAVHMAAYAFIMFLHKYNEIFFSFASCLYVLIGNKMAS